MRLFFASLAKQTQNYTKDNEIHYPLLNEIERNPDLIHFILTVKRNKNMNLKTFRGIFEIVDLNDGI